MIILVTQLTLLAKRNTVHHGHVQTMYFKFNQLHLATFPAYVLNARSAKTLHFRCLKHINPRRLIDGLYNKMSKHYGLLASVLVALLVYAQALPIEQPKQRQNEAINKNVAKRGSNEYGPPVHISSSVLQLSTAHTPHVSTLELPLETWPEESGSQLHLHGNSVYSYALLPSTSTPHIYTLDSLLPVPPSHGSHVFVSDNLDFSHNLDHLKLALAEQQLQHYAKSYGR